MDCALAKGYRFRVCCTSVAANGSSLVGTGLFSIADREFPHRPFPRGGVLCGGGFG